MRHHYELGWEESHGYSPDRGAWSQDQQFLTTAETATRQGLESFQKAIENFQKAAEQGRENLEKAAQQTQRAAYKAKE